MNAEEMTSERMTSDDYFKLYVRLEGIDEGRQQVKEEMIQRLFTLGYGEENITELMGLPIDFVQKIHAKLQEEAKDAPHEVNG